MNAIPDDPQVLVARRALADAVEAACAALPRETGGILLGFHTPDAVVVTRVVVVEDRRSTRFSYVRRRRRAQAALAAARDSAPPVVGYVGEWHTHPADQPPSRTDFVSLGQTAQSASTRVALLVVALPGDRPAETYAGVAARRGVFPIAAIDPVTATAATLTILDDDPEILERDAQDVLTPTTKEQP
jgi:integrative and conjugative element protein (TIGR02256 family)